MAAYGYTRETGKNEAKAVGLALPISYKHTVEVCNFVRGKPIEQAKRLLDEVIKMKRAIPYRVFNLEMAHNRAVGSGRFPIKTCKHVRAVIESAEANAQHKGLSVANLVVTHLAPQKAGRTLRFGRQRRETKRTHLEIIVGEGKPKEAKK